MTDIQHEIDTRVRSFVADLQALFGRHAIAAFQQAVAGGGKAPAAAPAAAKATKAAKGPKAKPAAAKRGGGGKAASTTGRRSQDEIEKTIARVLEYITANPGSRMEGINKGLGLPTKRLTRPISKLLSKGAIRREGQKRATTYFAADGSSAAAAKPAAKGGKGKAAKGKA